MYFENVRDLFSNASSQNTSSSIVTVSDVAWSICQTFLEENELSPRTGDVKSSPDVSMRDLKGVDVQQDYATNTLHSKNDPFGAIFSMPGDLRMADDSLIAAAGSNGVVLVWRACDLLRGLSDSNRSKQDIYKQFYGHERFGVLPSDSTSSSIGYPEAVLMEHTKAVKVAWHPNVPNQLLTASLDGTAKLWERSEDVDPDREKKSEGGKKWGWLGALSVSQFDNTPERSFSWKCKQIFKPNCGGIREIKWSSFSDDLFAMVTSNGFLVVYYTIVPHRPSVRIAAHAREATTVDWHPTKPYLIATGGVDMKVKVWDLEEDLSLTNIDASLANLPINERSHRSHESTGSSSNDASSPKSTGGMGGLDTSYHGKTSSSYGDSSLLSRSAHGLIMSNSMHSSEITTTMKRIISPNPSTFTTRLAKNVSKHLHELQLPAQVEKVHWRPPKRPINASDRSHFLKSPDSVAADHHEAMIAVATTVTGATSGGSGKVYLWSCHRPFMPLSIVDGHRIKSVADFIWLDTPDVEEGGGGISRGAMSSRRNSSFFSYIQDTDNTTGSLSGTWQHVLTVGKDGKCLVQSFCRGEKPISTVPPSAFAIAELSPFQKGYGSLQLIMAHQNVPSGRKNEFELCGFRRDKTSAKAPGIFKEVPVSDYDDNVRKFVWDPSLGGLEKQSNNLDLTFSTTDSGDLKDILKVPDKNKVTIAPEVIHLSRFADAYKLRRDSRTRTKAAVCRHNSNVAKKLNCMALSQMWSMLSFLLEGCRSDDLSDLNNNQGIPRNALSFALLPTLKSLLIERADAGDIQTCVVLCEVMEVINPSSSTTNSALSLTIPGLDTSLVRQWYLSYIELLQQMCLFSHATNLIRLCRDPEIAKLNQQSTTIHESCPLCFKPLMNGDRTCRSCRKKTGLCFLCHEPVKGIFVWCPGCGHGGHLEHALEWFGGNGNKASANSQCPTGCGHHCNLVQALF